MFSTERDNLTISKSLIGALLKSLVLSAAVLASGCTLHNLLGFAYDSAADHECRQANNNLSDSGQFDLISPCEYESEANNIRYREELKKIEIERGM